jgi:hypothetical protein
MLIFACPIIANSQCWLFSLRANIRICPHIRICPQISVFALIYPYLPSYRDFCFVDISHFYSPTICNWLNWFYLSLHYFIHDQLAVAGWQTFHFHKISLDFCAIKKHIALSCKINDWNYVARECNMFFFITYFVAICWFLHAQ